MTGSALSELFAIHKQRTSARGRPHEGYRDLRRALRPAPSSVHKYSFRPAGLRSHPHLIDPLHAVVHCAPELSYVAF